MSMGIVPQAIQEMFDFRFTAAALIDFEKTLAKLAELKG